MSLFRSGLDISRSAWAASTSMVFEPQRDPHRSKKTEWVVRLARHLLSEALDQNDDWLRERQNLFSLPGPALRRVTFKRQVLGQVPCLSCEPRGGAAPGRPSILYFHGGGYVVGSTTAYRYTQALLASLCACRVVVVDYRRSPEHPIPAPQEDCLRAARACMQEPGDWIWMGDSAGGALVLAVLAACNASEKETLAGMILLSPWVAPGDKDHLLGDGDGDDFVSVALLQRWAKTADPDKNLRQHLNFLDQSVPVSGLPVLVQSGKRELMQPQIAQLVELLRKQGGEVTWQEYPGQFHVFQTLAPLVTEAKSALQDVSEWVREHCSK